MSLNMPLQTSIIPLLPVQVHCTVHEIHLRLQASRPYNAFPLRKRSLHYN